ncbi:MAG: Spo0B domain-containing protein [Treponema sp.]|nr:Spo0B domain-containing protein [Treponema sp.]
MKSKTNKNKLESIRKEIKKSQMILIAATTLLLSLGGLFLNIRSNENAFNQDLQNTADLITRLYAFTKDYSQQDLCDYMDSIVKELPGVDVISIVDTNNNRIYHTHHELINTQYDGKHPDFISHKLGFYTEDDIGPSGPQRRTYSAIYDEGIYEGFIMTIRLQTSIKSVTIRTVSLFLVVTLIAVLIEIFLSRVLFRKIKKEFYTFAEDFEGTKFLVDSMRANNHDFTNKLHVILGLIQIGEYDKAVSYIENISIIQKETVSRVMHAVDNPSFSALLIGKIARASECNVKFILKEDMVFNSADIDLPSEALVTITGNLIDNALDAMNTAEVMSKNDRSLIFGVYTQPGQLLITVQDTGNGIPDQIKEKVFENGFSTKGTGRGVGLYHTKQLVESLGGSISFESQVGKGTCFMVNLSR